MAKDRYVRVVVTPVELVSVPMTGPGPGGAGVVHRRLENLRVQRSLHPIDHPFIDDEAAVTLKHCMEKVEAGGRDPLQLTYIVEFQLA